MKKSTGIIAAILTIVTAASCAKEITENIEQEAIPEGFVPVTFKVTNEATKAFLDSDMKVCWSEGDFVAVYDGIAEAPNKFTVVSVDGASATITGAVSEGTANVNCVYPFDAANGFDGTNYTVYVPNPQVIPTGKTIAANALVSVASAAIGGSLSFKNVTSLIEFSVSREDVSTVLFITNDKSEKFINNTTVPATGEPVATASSASRVKVCMQDGACFTSGQKYYIAIAPVSITGGISIVSGTAEEKYLKTSDKAAQFVRNGGLKFGDVIGSTVIPLTISDKSGLDAFAANAAYYTTSDCVKLTADIDYEGGDWLAVNHYTGNFDGQGHSIYNMVIKDSDDNSCAGFFGKLGTGSTISNLKLGYNPSTGEADGKMVLSKSPTLVNLGGLVGLVDAGSNRVTIQNVHNYIQVKTQQPEAIAKAFYLGGIVGYAGSPVTIENCSNNAVIANISSTKINGGYFGGIVGIIKTSNSIIDGCVNNAKIEVGNNSQQSATPFGGGITGRTGVGETNNIIRNCENKGNVQVGYQINYQNFLGGIIGADNTSGATGDEYDLQIINCSSTGALVGTTTGEAKKSVYGGIIGYAKSRIKISGCSNASTVKKGANCNQTASYGGIVGLADAFEGAIVENCTNSGQVISVKHDNTAEVLHCYGGIVGQCGIEVKDCTNTGEVQVNVTSTQPSDYAGGIVGVHTNDSPIIGCINTGNVSNTGTGANQGAGGFIGQQADAAVSTADGCQVNCTVTAANTANSGIIIGAFAGAGQASTWGSTASPVKVAGTVNGNVLSGANFTEYLAGANSSNASFNAIFATE